VIRQGDRVAAETALVSPIEDLLGLITPQASELLAARARARVDAHAERCSCLDCLDSLMVSALLIHVERLRKVVHP
jgi:hypothetical protein